MRTLVLLRHGKSDYPGGVRDHDRPLAPRGRREAALAGDWIRANLPPLDAVVCSTATRTRQTLERTGLTAPTSHVEEVYGASPGEIIDVLRGVDPDASTVLVVGHSPGMPGLALTLAGEGSDGEAFETAQWRFPTSAIAVVEYDGAWADLTDGAGRFVTLHIPRE